MAASTSDKFSSPTTNDRPSSATTTAIKTNGATSITVDSTSGWETANKVHFTMYEVDANDEKITSTQRDYEGIVNSATSINNVSIRGGADREFPIGAKVICAPTAAWADDLVDGILVHSNQDGTLKDDTVDTDQIVDSAVETAKLADGSATAEKLGTPVAFSVRVGSTQSVNDATITLVNFDTELFDYGSNYNTSTKQFTAPYDGVYEFSFFVRTDGAVTDGMQLLTYLYVNGSNVTRLSRSAGGVDKQSFTHVATLLNLSAGDLVDARIYHDHGSARNLSSNSTESLFSGKLIGRTD